MGVAERLIQVRKELKKTQGEMADILNIVQSSYFRYESGASLLNSDKLNELHDNLGINIHWLLTGQGNMFTNINGQEEYYSVPVLDVISKNSDQRKGTELIVHTIQIGIEFREFWGQNVCALRIYGDSMIPTIDRDGWVLVLKTNSITRPEGIYVFLQDNILRCKRVQKDMIGGIHLLSDNKLYNDEHYTIDTLFKDLKIIGEVVGIINRS